MFGFNFLRTKTEKLKWTKKRLKTSEKLCLESTEAKKLNTLPLSFVNFASFNVQL